jgi:hypothetical protein
MCSSDSLSALVKIPASFPFFAQCTSPFYRSSHSRFLFRRLFTSSASTSSQLGAGDLLLIFCLAA